MYCFSNIATFLRVWYTLLLDIIGNCQKNTENICLFAVLILAINKSVKADEGIHICYV